MPKFSVKWSCGVCIQDEKNRLYFRLILNNEWSILLPIFRVSDDHYWWNSIEIHRKKTAEELIVSGSLYFRRNYRNAWQKNFSQRMEIGQSFIEISPGHRMRDFESSDHIYGFVEISDIKKTPHSNPANKESREVVYPKSLERLSKDFEQILNAASSSFSDVTFKCGSVTIPAHKIILSARSPVFSAMFATPMRENLKNEVDITDISESTLRALLMYMYTGQTSDLTASSAADLLFAADKYQLQELKTICSDFLKDTVSSENVWRILVLGDMHDENLKSFAIDYICSKNEEFAVLENTQEWKTLRKERPDLALSLLESLMKLTEGKHRR